MARNNNRISDILARQIYILRQKGKSFLRIARIIGITKSLVQKVIKRRNGTTLEQKKAKFGPKRCTSTGQDAQLRLAMKRDRFRSNRSLAAQFQVSEITVRRRAKEFGLKSRLAIRKPLRKQQRTTRIIWARDHLQHDFGNWIFSDEVTFELVDCSSPRRPFVHCTKSERYSPACVLEPAAQGRRKIMVWGAISRSGKGVLAFLEGHINAESYIQVLQTNLLPYWTVFLSELHAALSSNKIMHRPIEHMLPGLFCTRQGSEPPSGHHTGPI